MASSTNNVGSGLRRSLPLVVGLLIVAALAAGAVSVQAQAPGEPPEALTEEELLSGISSAHDNAPDFALTATVEQSVIPEGLVRSSEGGHSGDSGPRSVRVWRGGPEKVRTEVQGQNGDKVFVRDGDQASAYDGGTNTLKTGQKPEGVEEEPAEVEAASPEEISEVLDEISPTSNVEAGDPVTTAGRWAYPLTLEPWDKDLTLVERAETLVDAETFVPLAFELYAQDTPEPVISYEARRFEVGPVSDEQFELQTPPGAKVEEAQPRDEDRQDREEPQSVASVDEAQRLVDFPVEQLAGTPGGRDLEEIKVAGESVVMAYGSGWGTVVLTQRPEGSGEEEARAEESSNEEAGDEGDGQEARVPSVDLGGGIEAKELSTPIGASLSWTADGVEYSLSGSVPAGELEEAARGLLSRQGG